MNFDGNFRRVGSANVELVKALIDALDAELWIDDEHPSTQTILLVHYNDFRHTTPTRHPALSTFEPVIRPILAVTADFYDESPKGQNLTKDFGIGYFVRAMLEKSSPGTLIPERRDTNHFAAHSHRVHIPVMTNADVRFKVGDEMLGIPQGEVYEINNRRAYSVYNGGDEPRVHLVLDYVLKGEMCCCGERYHPDAPCTPEACLEFVTNPAPCACFDS